MEKGKLAILEYRLNLAGSLGAFLCRSELSGDMSVNTTPALRVLRGRDPCVLCMEYGRDSRSLDPSTSFGQITRVLEIELGEQMRAFIKLIKLDRDEKDKTRRRKEPSMPCYLR